MMPAQRLPGVDALKGFACVLIVWHHLAFYGPMSDVVHGAAPGLMNWLYSYGRMAVQVFLVVGSFLAACSLAPEGSASFRQPFHLILKRYRRLALPLVVAVLISVGVAALVRPWLQHDSVPDAPTLWQLLSHLFLLQDLLGQEALSAGIWYVAIDFQLFAMTVLIFTLVRSERHRWVVLVLVLAAASLLVFNRRAGLDMTGLYFFGAYALGMLAWWASRSERPARWLQQRWMFWLGKVSYSVFLIHFPVCLLINAVVSHVWPGQLLANTLGLLAAFGLSLLAGEALYRCVESPDARWRTLFRPVLAAR